MRTVLVIATVLALADPTAHAESCTINSVTSVAFGNYDVFDASSLLAAGSVSYTCTGVGASDSVTIEIDGASSSAATRAMASGSHLLHYQLYLDAARTLIWGTGAGGTATYGPVHPADGAPTSVPIFGRVPARQDVPVGSYADTVIVTVLF